jgi:hypothetical protein
MNRRALLASGCVAVSTVCAGCLGGSLGVRGPDATPSCEPALNGVAPGSERLVNAWEHSDVPPYDASRPADAESESEWNPTYLGDGMATTPSLPFRRLDLDRDQLREPATFEEPSLRSYSVALIDSERERDRLLRTVGEGTDFGETVLVLVGECCGSSSVGHEWARVEATDAGVHLYGYHRQPYVQLTDLSPRYSLLAVDRPTGGVEVEAACASLTVGERQRVHVGSTDDSITLVGAVMANDLPEPVTGRLRITTAGGDRRVDGPFSIEAMKEWKGLGLVGQRRELLTVELTVEVLGVDLSTDHPADDGTLGIRIRGEGDAVVGHPEEI